MENVVAVSRQQHRRIKRAARGRFASSSPLNAKKIRRAQQQKKFVGKRKNINAKIFDGYLVVCVLEGTRSQSVSASRSKGKFVKIFESIVKKEFRLGPNLRYACLKTYYTEGGHISSAAGKVFKVPAKPEEYKGCRLPLVRYQSEMTQVREWIEFVEKSNALLQNTVEDAMEICKQILRGVDAENEDEPRHAELQDRASQSVPVRSSTLPTHDNIIGNSRSQGLTSTGDENRTIMSSLADETATEIEDDETVLCETISDEESQLKRKARSLFSAARNGTVYYVVHSVLDDSLEMGFGLFAKECLEEWEALGLNPPELVLEAVRFAHAKRCGVSSVIVQEKREKRLRASAAMLDKIRTVISTPENPLPLYGEMKWSFGNNDSPRRGEKRF